MPATFLKSRIVFDMCIMTVECSRGALLRICHLLLNLESCSGPVSSFTAVTMSTLQVTREVDVDRDSYMSASEQGKNAIGRTEFQNIWAEPVGNATSTSLTLHKVLVRGTILEHSITTVSVTTLCNQSFGRNERYKIVYNDFQAQHGRLGDPVSGLRISNDGNE